MNNVDFYVNNENHDLSRIYFKCPNCLKPYSSDPTKIYVEEPEYTCLKCKTEFSIPLSAALQQSEIIGTLLKTVQLPKAVKVEAIDAKTTLNQLQQEFDFKTLKDGNASFDELGEKNLKIDFEFEWSKVLKDYENRAVHLNFIEYCTKKMNLEFAIEKYGRLIAVNPNDALAQSFLKKIEFNIESRMNFESVKTFKMFTRSFYIILSIVCVGILMILMGTLWFQNKNIAGLGLGLIFFTFAAKAFFQPRQLGN